MSRGQRVAKMKDLLSFVVSQEARGTSVTPESAIAHLGLRGRIIDVNVIQTAGHFSDETKSMIFVRQAINAALRCPICCGLLDPSKSISYDDITPVSLGGTGDPANAQLAHPYCNTAVKSAA
jgi:hypothetical protein